MKQFLISFSIFFVLSYSVQGQNFEISLNSGVGIYHSKLNSSPENNLNQSQIKLTPFFLNINCLIKSTKQFKVHLGSGLGYTHNGFFFRINTFGSSDLSNLGRFSQKHLRVPIRLRLEAQIFNKNAIGLQYELQYNLARRKETTDRVEEMEFDPTKNQTTTLSYSLSNYTRNFFSNRMGFYLKSQLANSLFIITSIDYELRPKSGTVDFSLIRTYSSMSQYSYNFFQSTYEFEDEEINGNLIFFTIGLVKQF